MRLHIETMDAILIAFNDRGQVLFENDEWTTPSLQETRAILHAAEHTIATLKELIDCIEK